MYLTHRNIQHQETCAKEPEPKKFEKMIAYNPRTKHEKHRPVRINSNVRKTVITNGEDIRPARENNTIARGNVTNETNFTRTLNAISSYWFFMIGFLLGSACGMFTCYIWLARKISCCRGYRVRQRASDTQRISLLQNFWQLEDSALNESGTISCPGTPPPPYREVMLRPGLYRNPSVTTSMNNNNLNNVAASGARCT